MRRYRNRSRAARHQRPASTSRNSPIRDNGTGNYGALYFSIKDKSAGKLPRLGFARQSFRAGLFNRRFDGTTRDTNSAYRHSDLTQTMNAFHRGNVTVDHRNATEEARASYDNPWTRHMDRNPGFCETDNQPSSQPPRMLLVRYGRHARNHFIYP